MSVFDVFSSFLKPEKESEVVPVPDIGRVMKPNPLGYDKIEEIKAFDPSPDMIPDEFKGKEETVNRDQAWVRDSLDKLQLVWRATKRTNYAPALMKQTSKAVHDLYGIAEPCGFLALSRLSGSLCRLLESTEGRAEPELVRLHIEACRASFTQHTNGIVDDEATEAVCQALELRVRQIVSASGT